jgi:AraC family transcriptional regulator
MSTNFQAREVAIVRFPDTRVAVYEHRGDPRGIGESIRRFVVWRQRHGLPPHRSATFNILYNDPFRAEPETFRVDLCAAIEQELAPNDIGIVERMIPGGRCAVLRHLGGEEELGAALEFLQKDWLPRSGELLREFPPFIQRLGLGTDAAVQSTSIDAFLPIQ